MGNDDETNSTYFSTAGTLGTVGTGNSLPRVSILGEIVGATNLVAALRRGKKKVKKNEDEPAQVQARVSAFVKVYWGDKLIHQTSCIPNDNNPIWACDTGSLFLVKNLQSDAHQTLRLEVFDGSNKKEKELIGVVKIAGKDVVSGDVCNEQRIHRRIEKDDSNDADEDEENKEESLSTRLFNSFYTVAGSPLQLFQGQSDTDLLEEIDDEDSIYGNGNNSVTSTESFLPKDIDDDFIFGKDGTISVRFRVATVDDLEFLEVIEDYKRGFKYAKRKNQNNMQNISAGVKNMMDGKALAHLITEKSTAYVETVNCDLVHEMIDYRLNGKRVDAEGVKRLRVKPCPDPDDKDATRFLTHAEMIQKCEEPSRSWVEAGSGNLGQVKVEILRCEGLPNKDLVRLCGNKTDPFVSLVYEDCLVQTDRLSDCLSPMWMPWTQRAFVFNRMHALSSIYIGVFNHVIGPYKHHGCGRVTVDLRELQPNTVYTLKYELFSSPVLTQRKSKGTITIRLQISDYNHKNTVLSVLSPPLVHVNVKRRKTLAIARYTCYGKRREDVYHMKVLKSYIDEVLECIERSSFEIQLGINSLIFWRGQVRVWKFHIPLHSMVAFGSATYIIERPHLLPAYFFFCVAWIMIVLMLRRREHPSPWYRSKSFFHHLKSFIPFLPSPCTKGVSIDRYEGFKAQVEMEELRKKTIEEDKMLQSKIAAFRTELQEMLSALTEIHLDTTPEGRRFNPLSRLLPLQLLLRDILFYVRWVKTILNCSDSQISFLVTSSCIAIGLFLLVVPVVRVFHWICRGSIWLFLGPWMKLIDMSYSRRKSTEQKVNKHVQKMMDDYQKREKKKWYEARVSREEALKLKATRILRFGRFAVRVPNANIIRYNDYPLPESFATPLDDDAENSEVRVKNFVPGQKHFGVMIPQLAKSRRKRERERKVHEKKLMKLRQKYEYASLREEQSSGVNSRSKMSTIIGRGDPTMAYLDQEDEPYTNINPHRPKSVRFSVDTFESEEQEGFELVPTEKDDDCDDDTFEEESFSLSEGRDDIHRRYEEDAEEERDKKDCSKLILPSPSGNDMETVIETCMSDITTTAYFDAEPTESFEVCLFD